MINETVTPESLAAMVAAALLDGENRPFKLVPTTIRAVGVIFEGGMKLEVLAFRRESVQAHVTMPTAGDRLHASIFAPPKMAEATPESVAFVIGQALCNVSEQLRNRIAPLIAAKQAADGVSVNESPSAEARAKGAEMAAAALATRAAE